MSGAGEIIAGRYRLLGLLGEGAMGSVYRAEQLDSEGHALREVALKMIRSEVSRDPTFARRFLLEARVAARLESPHVVTIFESGQAEDGRLYFSMELVRAPTLKEVIEREGPIPAARVVEIAAQISEALAAAHGSREPIVHRDLKPANVFLAQKFGRDWVKVGDFGIAKVIGDEASALTGTGFSLGTPRYMAPEQWRGDAIDGRADLYSLGVLLYELLTGKAPFGGTAETLMYRHLNEPVPPLPASCPAGLRKIVESLLAKDRGSRPAAALELRSRLDAFSRGSDDATRPVAAPADQTEETLPLRAAAPAPKRRRAKWVVGAGALLGAGAVLAALRYETLLPWWGTPSSPPSPVATAAPETPPSRVETGARTSETPQVEPPPPKVPTDAPEIVAHAKNVGERALELEIHPPTPSVEIAACASQIFSARSAEPAARYEWWVNGEPRIGQGDRLEFTSEDAGRHRIRVVARHADRDRAHEWDVVVKPRAPTSEEVDRWLSDYGEALERQDVSLLRRLGEIRSTEDASAWQAKFAGRRDYEVRLENLQVELHPDRARLTFERAERWKDTANPGFVLDFASEAKTLVRERCQLVSSP